MTTIVRPLLSVFLVAAAAVRAQPAADPAVRLETFVTTGTRTAHRVEETPVRVELVPTAAAIASGSRTLADLVELTPGLRAESDCQNCNTTGIRILGLEQPYNVVLLDGVPFLSSLASVYGVDQVPARLIEQVEIVKGAASALYGPGAIGGVINLVPRTPYQNEGDLHTQFESMGGQAWGFGVGGVVSHTWGHPHRGGVTAYFQLDRRDPYDRDGDGYTELVRERRATAGLRAHVYLGAGRLTADYLIGYENRRGGDRLDAPPEETHIAEWLRTHRHVAALQWRQDLNSALEWHATLAATLTERDSYYGGRGDPQVAGYDPAQAAADAKLYYGRTRNPNAYFDGQFTWTAGRHILVFGPQYRWESVEDRYANPQFAPIDRAFATTSFYVQDEWNLGRGFTFLSGVRADRPSVLRDWRLTPRGALRWVGNEQWTVRASLATGFRAPEIFQDDLHSENAGGTPVQTRNAPGLKAEEALSGSLAIDFYPRRGNRDLRFEVIGFGTQLRNTFVKSRLPDPRFPDALIDLRKNGGGSQVCGVETNLAWKPAAHLELQAGVIVQRSPFDDVQSSETDAAGQGHGLYRRRLKTPNIYGTASAQWAVTPALDATLALKYSGAMLVRHRNLFTGDPAETEIRRSPDFWVWDLGLTRHIALGGRHVDLSLGVRNLTDAYQKDYESGASRDNDYVYGPRQPRTVFGSITLAF